MKFLKDILERRRERREWEDSQRVTQQQLVVELRRLNALLYLWQHGGFPTLKVRSQ